MTAACLLVRSPACSARQLQTSIVQVVHLCPTGFRKEPCERLERHKPKGLRVVLRGLGSSNAPRLPGGGGGDVTSLPDTWVGNHPGLPGPNGLTPRTPTPRTPIGLTPRTPRPWSRSSTGSARCAKARAGRGHRLSGTQEPWVGPFTSQGRSNRGSTKRTARTLRLSPAAACMEQARLLSYILFRSTPTVETTTHG